MLKNGHNALSELLVSLFSSGELRRFLAFGPDGPKVLAALPGDSASLSDLVFKAVSLLERYGMISVDLFERLLAEFPRRTADIERVMQAWEIPKQDLGIAAEPPLRPSVRERPRFAVITALQLETTAMLAQLDDIRERTLSTGTIILTGVLRDGGHEVEVAVTQTGPGNAHAAVLTTDVGLALRPSALLFVGIAGAIKDLQLGDVVAATKVYGYASGKAADAGKGKGSVFLARPDVGNSTNRMEQRARADALRGRWLARRKQSPTGTPTAVVGPIAAGEIVVASTRSETYRFLREHYSDAVAVEMEGRGFLAAAHLQHAEALVIRGISDRIDKKSSADAKGWQLTAADNAAAFAAEVMLNLRFNQVVHA